MTLSGVLDVAIALVFIYFLSALIASGLQEVIASLFAWRGTYLSKGIDVILDNTSDASFRWVDFKDFLTAHFTPRPGQTAAERLEQTIKTQPGGPTPGQAVLQRVLSVQTHPLLRSVASDLPSYIPARNFSLALLETLRDGSAAPTFAQAQHTIAALPDGDLKKTLSTFLQDAGGDLDALRGHLERWFDDAMDRVSGIYKRLSRYVLLSIGVLLAIGLNLDSFHLARTLWEMPGLRAVLVTNAGTSIVPANAPSTSDAAVRSPAAPAAPSPGQNALAAMRQLEDQQVPFGWDFANPAVTASTIAGWIISACAIGLGAPFWFSLLQNLTAVRNTGPKPKRSDEA